MVLSGGCSAARSKTEGIDPSQCNDNADNDRNGLFDCNDPGCFENSFCKSQQVDTQSSKPSATTNKKVAKTPPAEPTSKVSPAEPKVSSTTGWLKTLGNKIYHADGTVFRGRGANIHDTRGCNACVWDPPDVKEVKRRIDTLVDEWGANFVRLVLESYDVPLNRVHWKGPLKDPGYLKDITEIVKYIGTKPNVYVLVSLWTHPSHDKMGWPTEATIPVWEALAKVLVDQPHVLFGVVNEPKLNYDGAHDAEVWSRMNNVVAAIRAVELAHKSPKHLIAVQGTRAWGRYLGYYIKHPIAAGGGENIVYETHSYMQPSEFKPNWIVPSKTIPVIIGEFAPSDIGGGQTMTISDTIAMMDEAELRDIPWAAWTFHQRCGPKLIEDHIGRRCGKNMKLTPTEWGNVIKTRLSQPWKTSKTSK